MMNNLVRLLPLVLAAFALVLAWQTWQADNVVAGLLLIFAGTMTMFFAFDGIRSNRWK